MEFPDGSSFLFNKEEMKFDLIFLNIMMPEINGAVSEINEKFSYLKNSLPYFNEVKAFLDLKNRFRTGSIPVEKEETMM